MDNNAKASNGASIEQKKAGKKPVDLKDVDNAKIAEDMNKKYSDVAIDCVVVEFEENVRGKETEGSSSAGSDSNGSTHVGETTTVDAVGTQHLANLQQAVLLGEVVTITAKGARTKAKTEKTAGKDEEAQQK